MRVLLDTHILLWALTGSKRLGAFKDVILDADTDVFISAASWWELAIKIGLGKLDADLTNLRKASTQSGFLALPVHDYHTDALLKLAPIHRDPFDRMLIAQAITEPMRLLTADKILADYNDLVWSL